MNHKECLSIFLVLITLFLTNLLIAQTTVKGQIFDEYNEPLIGASIIIKGTTAGAVSDIDGYFTIITDQEFPFTLLVTFAGFTSKEIEVTAAIEKLVVLLSGASAYDEKIIVSPDPSMTAFENAEFPFPPPKCHTAFEMPRAVFSDCDDLGDVAEIISTALDAEDYPYNFLSVPKGFAVVAKMEQYNKDGTIIQDSETRWVHYPKQDVSGWSIEYFASLIFPKKGYLRMFVYIVTSVSYSSTEEKVDKDLAASWHWKGVNKLPSQIAEIPFSKDYSVRLLLYEFEVPESNHKAQQNCQCRFQAKEHLKLSGLKDQFFK